MYNKPIALVTGASSGIGEALCIELIKQGYRVIGVARSRQTLDLFEKQLGFENFYSLPCDVSQRDEIETVSKKLQEEGIYPTLFFLNAGVAGEIAVENPNCFDIKKHEQVMAVNYFGVLIWVQAWEQFCKEKSGAHFMVTSSVNAIFAPPSGSAYAASKAAIAKAFEGLALTYFGTNLSFSVVYPGPVATKGLKGSIPFTWQPDRMAKYMIRCALKKKSHCEPSLFHAIAARIFNKMPLTLSAKILNRIFAKL